MFYLWRQGGITYLDVFDRIGMDIFGEGSQSIKARYSREFSHKYREHGSMLVELGIWTHDTRLDEGALYEQNCTDDHLVGNNLFIVVNWKI
jgi:hypothetical protein